MTASNASGKKIIFKKKIVGENGDGEDLFLNTDQINVEESKDIPDDTAFHFHGEIFDQFYRPIGLNGGTQRLAELALEPLSSPVVPRRLDQQERTNRNRDLQNAAEALAHHIYNLAQKIRETDLDVYLSAFNVVLADRACEEAKVILDRANEFFTEHYYTPIRDRGERPEIYHQIIKRVGHEAGERIGKIVKGLDVGATARALWDLYHGAHADKASRIEDILLDLTEKQIRSIREEFLLIPYKDLARQLHHILNRPLSDSQQPAKRTIGKAEVYGQKKQQAYRSRDDLRAIRYLLLGRSVEEVSLIKRFYLDLGDAEAADQDISLESDLKRRLLPLDAERAGNSLTGWSARREAEEIYKILYPPSLGIAIEDVLCDPRDSVDRDHTQGIGPYLKRFGKRRMWRRKDDVTHHMLNSFEVIAERISALSTPRYLQTNEALQEMYGIELDPTLFASLGLFDARRKAILIRDRLDVCSDLFEMLLPIEFLNPRQCLAVQKAYQCLYGLDLRAEIEKRAIASRSHGKATEVQDLMDRYLMGHGRWPLNIDILARFRGEEPPPGVWEHDFRVTPEDEDAAIELANLLDSELGNSDTERKIHHFLWQRSVDSLNRLERAFFELTDPHIPLCVMLSQQLSREMADVTHLLLAGYDVKELAQRLHDDVTLLTSMRDLTSDEVRVLKDSYRRAYFSELEQAIQERLIGPEKEDLLIDILSVVLLPQAKALKVALQPLRKDGSCDLEALRTFWSGTLIQVMALERAFDLIFPRLRVQFKLAAARQALSPAGFAEAILSFEGIDPDVTARILECFDAVDIGGLQDILRANRDDQKTIEEAYDLLFPDATLRRSVKEMKVDLDLINETLLHIEGFYAREVAAELHQLVSSLDGDDLGRACLEILATPSPSRPNHRIPEDINWMDEMVFQIALAYNREYGNEFLAECRVKRVPDQLQEELTIRVFGHEVCTSARDIFNLLKANKEGRQSAEYSEERLCTYLETRGARHRDRLIRAYASFWAHTPGFGSLIDDISRFFTNSAVKKKLIPLMLGAGFERKQVVVDPVTVH